MARWSNWAGNVVCDEVEVAAPATVDDVRRTVSEATRAGRTIRVAGAGHSFSPICASDGIVLDLSGLAGIESIDPGTGEATIFAGSRLHELGEPLFKLGRAFANQGDIDRQAIAGAVATGTHGTGRRHGSFSNAVRGVEVVTATGDLVTIDERSSEAERRAAALSLGMLGVVTRLRLATVTAYKLHERSVPAATFTECLERYHETEPRVRNAEFWWIPPLDKAILKTMVETGEEPRGEPAVEYPPGTLERYLKPERVDWSYKVYPSTRTFRFVECEHTLPIENGPAAVSAIRELIRTRFPGVHWVVEYRTLAGERHLLSPTQGHDSVTISVHDAAGNDWTAFMRAANALLGAHGGRPHWGKLHWLTRDDVDALYPEAETFRSVRRSFDPGGVFLNDHLRPLFG